MNLPDRQSHQPQVLALLRASFGAAHWDFSLPYGWGNETYFARDGQQTYFVKLGVHIPRYQAMASLGLTPPVLAAGALPDGTSVIVQPAIPGKKPSRRDYRASLEQVAAIIHQTHHSPAIKRTLPQASSPKYNVIGLEVLDDIQGRWQRYRTQVPEVAQFVDDSLATLARQVASFEGSGLVASHNDICNANWLVSTDG
jgi:hypothetical protein